MSVDKTPTGVVYTVTNGAAGQQYPLTFPYINGADVKAYYVLNGAQTVLTYGVHYAVASQTFTASIALPLGAKLAIYRQTDLTQEILWKDGQAVYTPDIMKADDKLTLIAQEISADMSRTVKLTREEEAAGGNPEEVVAAIYASRDAAAASANAASAQATAAQNSATAAANSADTAAQTVQTAAAAAVNAATAQADAAELAAQAAAQSAANAYAASEGMAPRMDAAEQINTQQDNRLDVVENGLAGKANLDMDNLTQVGTTALARYAKPSSRNISLSMQPSPFDIIAPGNGTITVRGGVTGAGQNCSLFNITSAVGRVYVAQGPQVVSIDIPCKKDDLIRIYHDLRGTFEFFKFVYDEGAY